METVVRFGRSQRGRDTLIAGHFEYCYEKTNEAGVKVWRCSKRQMFHCKAFIKTKDDRVCNDEMPQHTHGGNVATALAKKAVSEMKNRMTETIATPSSSQAAVVVDLAPQIQMALPKRSSLSRLLRRRRQMKNRSDGTSSTMPPIPTDLTFVMPERFADFILYDSGSGDDRLILLGDRELLRGRELASTW